MFRYVFKCPNNSGFESWKETKEIEIDKPVNCLGCGQLHENPIWNKIEMTNEEKQRLNAQKQITLEK